MKTINSSTICLSALLCFLMSCSSSMNDIGNAPQLIQKMRHGDISAYKDLRIVYLDYPPTAILPYAKYAVDSLRYFNACLDILDAYISKYNIDMEQGIDLKAISDTDRTDFERYFTLANEKKISGIEKYKVNK